MTRTVVSRLVGAFLLIYGVGAIVMGWWAYNVTHEAFVSVRNFTTAFEQERDKATQALRGATDLLGGRSAAAGSTSGSPSLPGGSPSVQGLRDRLRGLFGGGQPQ